MREIVKGLKILGLTLFAYLFQACAMHYFEWNSITPSLPFCVLAVFVVSLGKKYAFCASCTIGILMECMLSNVPAMYVLAYPVITMLCAQAFADLSDRQRERRLSNYKGKTIFSRIRRAEMPALLRIPLCAGLMDLIWHIVMCVYMYLIGVDITFTHFTRMFSGVLYTCVLTVVLMLPLRLFLGMYRRKRRTKEDDEDGPALLRRARIQPDDEEYPEDTEEQAQAAPEDSPESPDGDEMLYPEEGE